MLSHLILTFGVSWGGILIVLIATGFDLSAPQPTELALIFVLMLLGPSVSGLTLIALLDGLCTIQLCVGLQFRPHDGAAPAPTEEAQGIVP